MALPNGVQPGNGVAHGKAAKRELVEKLIDKPKTGGYRPNLVTMGGMMGGGGFGAFGGFTLWQVEQMRDDPKISIGLEFKNAPIYNAEFEISGHAEQSAYAAAMLKRFWQKSLNVALDVLRRRKETTDIATEPLVAGGESPEASVERKERAEQVRQAVLAVSPASRAVLVLREYEGLTYQEIAEALDIPIGTVMSRLNYARGQIRKALARYLEVT